MSSKKKSVTKFVEKGKVIYIIGEVNNLPFPIKSKHGKPLAKVKSRYLSVMKLSTKQVQFLRWMKMSKTATQYKKMDLLSKAMKLAYSEPGILKPDFLVFTNEDGSIDEEFFKLEL